jgi:UDP-glucose:tetrahydrobiopterin glucosyltransferase
MRILLVSTPIGTLGSGAGGGVELTVVNVARGLRERGHRVAIVAPEGSVAEGFDVLPAGGVPPRPAQHEPRDAPVVLPAGSLVADLFDVARRHQREADVVVNFAYDWLGFYLTPFFTTPLAHVVGMGSLSEAVDRALASALDEAPGRVAVHSRAQAETFAFADRLVVVGNGLDLDRYRYSPVGEPALAWVARLSPEKGLEDAAAAAARTGLPLRIWGVVEDPAYWARVRAGVPAGVLDHRGFVATGELQAELGRCQALLVTPRWVEAYGNVVAEALAVGVPVICYRRGGPPELVRDGRTGFVVEPDSIDGLVDAIRRLDRIDRAACRRQAEDELSLAALAERYERWLAPIVSRSAGGTASSPAPR